MKILLAIAIAIAVPVSTLKLYVVTTSCCCPDPSKCHCPDHKGGHGSDPTMRACHKSSQVFVTPELPAFEPTEVAIAEPDQRPVETEYVAAIPHAPPVSKRPAAPS